MKQQKQDVFVEIALPHNGNVLTVSLDPSLTVRDIIHYLQDAGELPRRDLGYIAVANGPLQLEMTDSLNAVGSEEESLRLLFIPAPEVLLEEKTESLSEMEPARKPARSSSVPGLDVERIKDFSVTSLQRSAVATTMLVRMFERLEEECRNLRGSKEAIQSTLEERNAEMARERDELKEELSRFRQKEDDSWKSAGLVLTANLLTGVGGSLVAGENWKLGILVLILGIAVIGNAIHLMMRKTSRSKPDLIRGED